MARTGSCHLQSGKNRFLPSSEWQEPVLATLKKVSSRLKGNVMGSGKNQFLPLEKKVSRGLKGNIIGSGKNRFLPFEEGSQRG